MSFISKLFGSGAKATIGTVFDGIDKVTTSGEERMQAKANAIEVVVETQCRIVEAEAKAGGLAASWRPIAALSFVAMVWWWALSPALEIPPPDLSGVPVEVWAFLMGYGTLREVGKTAGLFDKRKKK